MLTATKTTKFGTNLKDGYAGDVWASIEGPTPTNAGNVAYLFPTKTIGTVKGVTKCDYMDIYYITSRWGSDGNYWKAIGCHEAAHALGVGERDPSLDQSADGYSCATNPPTGSTTSFDTADISWINTIYGAV